MSFEDSVSVFLFVVLAAIWITAIVAVVRSEED